MSPSFADEEALFSQALALPAGEREVFLAAACGPDTARRARIGALLAASEARGETLGAAPVDAGLLGEEVPGARIGRYKLLQKIGEGGCGTVYLADQLEPVRRRVALKIIKLGMATREVIARFELERQALALMDHPNIAHVLDAGATATGRPYFVMELVRGVPITRFCDECAASTEQRLELFIRVCHAVQHAHQKGIIHRDLKPSNILVTSNDGSPVPKVIDFGIAKATQGRLTDETVFTAFEQFVGTPAYMSPEQAVMTCVDVDTRSDIYSLGVLLYELLTGRTPFDANELRAVGLDEVRRRIREVDPPKPSTRLGTLEGQALTLAARCRQTEPPRLISLIRGDLDRIVMRCLEKDRVRRYPTANGLAVDLQRHLHHQPVSACPPSAAYRVGKFIRRHRTGVAALGAIAFALVLGVLTAAWQAVRARQAERRAEIERDLADSARLAEARARHMAEQRSREADGLRAAEAEQRRQAEANERRAQAEAVRSAQAAQFMRDMLKGVGPRVALGRDTKLLRDILEETVQRIDRDLAGQPEVEAEMRLALGEVFLDLGDYAQAGVMYDRAVALGRAQAEGRRALLAGALCGLGRTQKASGKTRAAEPTLREAVEIYRRLDDYDGWSVAVSHYGSVLAGLGRADECERILRERLDEARRRWGVPSRPVANAMVGLGYTPHQLPGRSLAESEQLLREAVAMFREVDTPDGTDSVGALNGLALVLTTARKYAEAEKIYRELIPLWEKRRGADHPDLATPRANLAMVLKAQGKLAEAEAWFRAALQLQRRFLGGEHPSVALALSRLGSVLTERGQFAEAESLLIEALEIQTKRALDSSRLGTLYLLLELAVARQDGAAAEAWARQRLTLARDYYGQFSPQHANALASWSRFLRELQRPEDARVVDDEVAEIRIRLDPVEQTALSREAGSRGGQLRAQGRLAEAEQAFREELVQRRELDGRDSEAVMLVLYQLSQVYVAMGNFSQAEATLRELLRTSRIQTGYKYVNSLHNLGYVLLRQDRLAEAEAVLRQVLGILQRGPRSHLVATYSVLAETLQRQNRPDEVEALWREAIAYARSKYGDGSEEAVRFTAALVRALVRGGKPAEAEPLARLCVDWREKQAPESWRAAEARSALGEVLYRKGNFEEAAEILRAAFLALKGSSVATARGVRQEAARRLAECHTAWGRPDRAAEWTAVANDPGGSAPIPTP